MAPNPASRSSALNLPNPDTSAETKTDAQNNSIKATALPEGSQAQKPQPWKRGLAILGWMAAGLGAIDLAASHLFAYPDAPTQAASSLATYFNYGRSSEGKLKQLVGTTDAESHALATAGWLTPEALASRPSRAAQNSAPTVALYGMSFTEQIGDALVALNPDLGLRTLAAPSASPSYALAAYQADQAMFDQTMFDTASDEAAQTDATAPEKVASASSPEQAHSKQPDVVILGVLAHSVKAIQTMTGATWLFESPSAYGYPRYRLEGDELVTITPVVQSAAELRQTLKDRDRTRAYRQQLAEQDAFYHPLLFNESVLDQSTTLRLLRRALAQQHQSRVESKIHDGQGFIDPETNQLLEAIAMKFAQEARDRNQLPIVLLIDSQNYDDHLFTVLESSLTANQIPHLSTHSLAPADDSSNYVPDGHFTPAVNEAIAQSLLTLMQSQPSLATEADLESKP